MSDKENGRFPVDDSFIVECLDSADNEICIYDRESRLLYANKAYCDAMNIHDRDSALGMNIQDNMKQSGITIHATKNGSDRLKMLDIFRTGRKAINWEISVEAEDSPNNARFIVNNLYPVKSRNGSIDNIIEIASVHSFDLNKTKKLMGLTAEYTFDSIIGESQAITEVKKQASDYAKSSFNLLITGESGVGKELFAQAVHNLSPRRECPFVAINCASLPENLIESELFGYVSGAFTGADKSGQVGKFELADGGTIFLDEIGELPVQFQAKLLRTLETGKITRIGSSRQTQIDVRVIAATNRDLPRMIEEGLFREDLYYRLQVLSICIPPLRERQGDILLLAAKFLSETYNEDIDLYRKLSPGAREGLIKYSWPGNIRELRNAMYRVSFIAKNDIITAEDIDAAICSREYRLSGSNDSSSADRLEQIRSDISNSYRLLVEEALSMTNGNKKEAAVLLGITRQTLYRMIDKYCR